MKPVPASFEIHQLEKSESASKSCHPVVALDVSNRGHDSGVSKANMACLVLQAHLC